MVNNMLDEIKNRLIKSEGLALFPYSCQENYLSLGIGRNIQTNGISEDEAMYMLENDIKRVIEELDQQWDVWRTFPVDAQMVCVDLVFNLGITGFMRFSRTRYYMENGDFLAASEELLRSKYHIQLPRRSEDNSRMLALCHKNLANNLTKPSD